MMRTDAAAPALTGGPGSSAVPAVPVSRAVAGHRTPGSRTPGSIDVTGSTVPDDVPRGDVLQDIHIPLDHAGFGVLTFDVCLRLVTGERVGRVAFVADGEVLVLPVNYTVDGNAIAFRSRVGSKLSAATDRSVVAFEVDGYEPTSRIGWSVLMNGSAETVQDEAEIARLEAGGLAPWSVNLEKPSWVRIHWDSVSGRTTLRGPATGDR